MDAIARLRAALRGLLRRRAMERDLEEELAFHLERDAERYVAGGLSLEAARIAARRSFGNVPHLKEQSRDARGLRWVEELAQDVRYAIRGLARRPLFTFVVLATLAVGIGVNSAAFSVIQIFLQPLDVRDPKSVVGIEWTRSRVPYRRQFTYDDFMTLRAQARSLSTLVASSQMQPVLLSAADAAGVPRKVYADFVSNGYFALLNGDVGLGRGLVEGDNLAPAVSPVLVLSHRFWRSAFGGDSTVLGKPVTVNGKPLTVVGVAREGFVGAGIRAPDFWLPMMMRGALAPDPAPWFGGPDQDWLSLTGRIAASRTLGDVRAEIAVLGATLARGHPGIDPRIGMDAFREGPLGHVSAGDRLGMVTLGMLAPVMVLLIACANLANVMLARAAGRQREIAVRLSLGASRGRLVRLLLAESSLLAAMGGAVGLAIVWWAIRAFGVTAMDALGFRDPVTTASRITVDGTVLAVTLVVVVGTIVAFGLAPALKATRTDLTRAIKGEGAALFGAGIARSRFRGALVVTQVALSLVLLVAAGVLAHAIRSIAQVEVGFDHEHVLVIDARPSLVGYDSVRADAFGEELVRRAAALPSVRAAARAATAPFEAVWGAQVRAIGPAGSQAREPTLGQINFVTPGYFGVLGIPILLGRTFTNDERASSEPVAVVSETLARLLWPGGDALGARISWDDKLPPATVVGIVRDARQMRLGTAQRPMIYAPLTPRSGARASDPVVLLRTDADPRLVIPAVRAIVRAVDPAMYAAAFPLRSVLENSDAARAARTVSASTLALGVFALFLTAVGLYGVVSFAVAQGTREIGIRMALGAGATDVVRAALAQVSRFVAIGAVIGLGGSLAATSAMRSLLLGIRPMDPAVFGGVALLLGAVAVVATWIPARRATQVDPLVALRHE